MQTIQAHAHSSLVWGALNGAWIWINGKYAVHFDYHEEWSLYGPSREVSELVRTGETQDHSYSILESLRYGWTLPERLFMVAKSRNRV